MLTIRESVGAAAVVIGAAVLAAVSHHAGGQGAHARRAVESAAHRLTYQDVADGWTRMLRGDTSRFDAIVHSVALPYRATHQQGDGLVVTFASRHGICVDLVARPAGNSVETRSGC